MSRRGTGDAEALADMLKKGVVLVGGEAQSDIDLDDDTPVFVALVMDVSGYGPHTASIYALQNQYHARTADSALQPAYEIHEEWMREHYEDHLKELYEDARKDGLSEEDAWQRADEWFMESVDGSGYKLTPMEAFEVIRHDKRASKYIGFTSRERNIKIKPSKK